MGGGQKPQIPDAMDVSRQHLDLNRFNQQTPWGSQTWDGDRLVTQLNPMDQQRLGMQRQLQQGLLGAALGGQGGAGGGKPASQGAPMPPMG